MIQNRIITETTITSSSTHIITILVDNLVKRNCTIERMDFLALIPQPSGRIEHLPPDLLNLILQSTASHNLLTEKIVHVHNTYNASYREVAEPVLQ